MPASGKAYIRVLSARSLKSEMITEACRYLFLIKTIYHHSK